jgi:hypothetical protein
MARRDSSRPFSYPELVHAGEKRWILHLKIMPECQIGHCRLIGETLSEILQGTARQVEPQELELVVAKKIIELWQRKLMFLNVEQ